ncbi:hypothetical protein SS50377_26833 [Spironucleus salmonicida]|uniref:Hikeshi-like domain-containing protein n=1 Tax=Spironucleus salmonicida TaxID=348837 RepID=V6LZW5_9EUKA|nr:hypothetical protein SS50377_26833 [Spironucleus salmonicida]|eukprot:EST49301.1 hypothetical protein SS50377_10525 [Spironucleus salmonicida]
MFGCVIDTYGYTDQFSQEGTNYILQIPQIHLINHISLFCYDQSQLANLAFQISIINGDQELKVGFLTDFQPAITFNPPKVPPQQKTLIQLSLCNYNDVFVQTEHLLTTDEDAMVNFQTQRMLKNFQEHLQTQTVENNNQVYIPLATIKKWKDQYIQYLYNTK